MLLAVGDDLIKCLLRVTGPVDVVFSCSFHNSRKLEL